MTIFIINGKAHMAVSNGFKPIPDLTYYEMLERSEIQRVEVLDYE